MLFNNILCFWGGRCRGQVLFYPGGNILKTFACGLGIGTKNYVKILALFLGLKMSSKVGVYSLIVIGDSLFIISRVIQGKYISDQIGGHLQERILHSLSHFESLRFFHVLKEVNHRVDELANQTSYLHQCEYNNSEGNLILVNIP